MNVLRGFRTYSNHLVTCLRSSLYKITWILRVYQKSDKIRKLKSLYNYFIENEVPKSVSILNRIHVPVVLNTQIFILKDLENLSEVEQRNRNERVIRGNLDVLWRVIHRLFRKGGGTSVYSDIESLFLWVWGRMDE